MSIKYVAIIDSVGIIEDSSIGTLDTKNIFDKRCSLINFEVPEKSLSYDRN